MCPRKGKKCEEMTCGGNHYGYCQERPKMKHTEAAEQLEGMLACFLLPEELRKLYETACKSLRSWDAVITELEHVRECSKDQTAYDDAIGIIKEKLKAVDG